MNTLSECTYFYISKNIASYTFQFVFKIVDSLQCILKDFLPSFLQIWSHLLKKSLMNNFIFCAMLFVLKKSTNQKVGQSVNFFVVDGIASHYKIFFHNNWGKYKIKCDFFSLCSVVGETNLAVLSCSFNCSNKFLQYSKQLIPKIKRTITTGDIDIHTRMTDEYYVAFLVILSNFYK